MPIESTQGKKILPVVIHIIIWGIVVLFPLIFLYTEGERNVIRLMDFSLPIIFMMIVFYTNYFLLIGKYLFRKKVWQFFAANILLFIVCLVVLQLLKHLYFDAYFMKAEIRNHLPPRSKMKNILLFRDMLTMAMTVGLATAIKMTIQWYHSLAGQKELEKLHFESELNNLKHQLNPHFLFNTLNNIYSLISINQENAQSAVHQLSNLIRYVLYDSDHPQVPLSRDLAFTTNYIKLMSLRLPAQVKLNTRIDEAGEGVFIAPLLFISLVENAFKHGVSADEPSHIDISITVTLEEVECRIENSNFPKPGSDRSGSGIGLQNLRKRLELIYPSSFSLDIRENPEIYVTTLKIRL